MERKKVILSWLWVALCILAIFAVVPVARTIQKFVTANWGRALFGYSVLAATGIAFAGVLYLLIFRLKIRSVSNYIWLTLIAGLYAYFTIKLWMVPEEAVHFLQYGLLGYFLFRALSHSVRDKTIYLAAFFIGSIVGTFDEILQWVVPERFWDFRDAGINVLAGGLFQVALWKGIKPKIISEKISLGSVRKASLLMAANLILLGLCLSNTPERVAAYTKAIPRLAFLQKQEIMHDYRTARHTDPEIGVFSSRLGIEELRKIDAEAAAANGQILREWKDREYTEFLRTYGAQSYPFLHEFRVRVFRRDKKLEGGQNSSGKQKIKAAFLASYKENLILEKYFSQTLAHSPYKWGEEIVKDIEAKVDKTSPYKSPVGSRFLLFRDEKTTWLAIASILILLALINIIPAILRL